MSDATCPKCGAAMRRIHIGSNGRPRPTYQCGRDGPKAPDTVPCLLRQLAAVNDERDELARQNADRLQDCERLNQMLRESGQGQGAIDAYVAQCEELDRAMAETNQLYYACENLKDETAELRRLEAAVDAAKETKDDV